MVNVLTICGFVDLNMDELTSGQAKFSYTGILSEP